ncbi:hypothetical protein AALA24_12625 [Anaerovoracaceae bacterium 42-11]
MKFKVPANPNSYLRLNEKLLAKIFDNIDLLKDEIDVLNWLSGQDKYTIETISIAIEKTRLHQPLEKGQCIL